MAEELSEKKISIKKVIVIILLVILTIGIISCFTLYREHKMRRAFVGVEGLTFDGIRFERCTNYALTNTLDTSMLEKSEMICKTTDGDWIIWAVEGYEDNLEYVYANCFMDGFFYERVE